MARYTVRPTRSVSALTGVVGLILGIVGLVYFGTRYADGGGSGVPLAFVSLWLVVCLALTGYHLYNALTGKAPALRVIGRDNGPGR
jgi:hypothetical protein